MKRKNPKYIGTGIYVHFITDCIKGDTFFDADWGLMEYDGKKWVSKKL